MRRFGAGISPQEMMAIYAADVRNEDPYREEKGALAVENANLLAAERTRRLSEPSEAERAQEKEQAEQFRFTINKYSEMIRDEKLSPTSRDLYKQMMKNYISQFPKEYQQSAGPALAYSPIDPVAEGLDKFERLYPRPIAPQSTEQTGPNAWKGGEAPRDPTNELAWAKHDISLAEWNLKREMMQDKLAGINVPDKQYVMQTLFPSSTDNKFYYKDKYSGQIGYVDMKYIPQGEFKAAIEKYNWGMPDFMRTGMYPLGPEQTETLGDTKYSVRQMRNVMNGGVLIDRVPLGPKESGSEKLMDARLMDALSVSNMGGDEKLLKDPTALYTYKLLEDVKDSIGTTEAGKTIDRTNAILMNNFGYVIGPYSKDTEDTWRKHLPLIGGGLKQYTMSDGTFMGIGPVRKTPVPFMNGQGQGALLYWSDAVKMAFDANLNPVPETKGLDVPKDVDKPVLAPNLPIEPRKAVPRPKTQNSIKNKIENVLSVVDEAGKAKVVDTIIKFFKSVPMDEQEQKEWQDFADSYKKRLEGPGGTK